MKNYFRFAQSLDETNERQLDQMGFQKYVAKQILEIVTSFRG